MFGRKLRLTFFNATIGIDQNAVVIDVDTLHNKRGYRVNGVVDMQGFAYPPTAELDIYNLSTSELLNITNLRYKEVNGEYLASPLGLQIEAGYSDGDFDTIFFGRVLRPTTQRPEPQTSVLHIYAQECNGSISNEADILQSNWASGVNWYSVADSIIKQGLSQEEDLAKNYVIKISDKLKDKVVDGQFLSYGNSLYQYVKQISLETGVKFLINHNYLQLGTWEDFFADRPQQAVVLKPSTGLVGIPSLSTDGLTCTSLLNPKIAVFTEIVLDNKDVSIEITDPLANLTLGVGLSSDGRYFVAQYTHEFDTAVGAFQTTMRCLSQEWMQQLFEEDNE